MPLIGTEAGEGTEVTAIDDNVAPVTFKFAVPVLPPKLAVMMAGVPAAVAVMPVARPVVAPTVALAMLEVQLESIVTSRVDPSL